MTVPTTDHSRRRKSPPATTSNYGPIGALTSAPTDATPSPNPDDVALREQMIRRAAYFRSQHRRPCPGKELEDWLVAEQEVDEWLTRAAMPPA